MAPVNPQIQSQNAPFYGYFSRPIEQPKPDTTIGTALAGLGNVVSEGAKAADFVEKSDIENKLYNAVDQQRESFTGALEQVAGIPPQNRVADIQPDANNIIPGSTATPVPAALQQGLDKVGSIQNAFSNGKLRPTSYQANLDVVAKDLRNQYPGYRDYIDQTMSRITGGNPANQYMADLLNTINQNVTNSRSAQEKMLSEIYQHAGYDGANEVAAGVMKGTKGILDVTDWLHRNEALDVTVKKSDNDLKLLQNNVATAKIKANDNLDDIGTKIINNNIIKLDTALSAGGGKVTSLSQAELPSFMENLITGKIGFSETEGQMVYQSLKANRAVLESKLQTAYDQAGITRTLGADAVHTAIQNKLGAYDKIIDLAGSKETGLAFYAANRMRTLTDDSALTLRTKSKTNVEQFFNAISALKEIGGQNAVTPFIVSHLPEVYSDLKGVLETKKLNLAAGIPDENGNKPTLQQYLQDLQNGGVGVQDTTKASSDPYNQAKKREGAVYNSLVDVVTAVNDPKLPDKVKQNVINGVYGPGNDNLINMFSTKDKSNVYLHLFSPTNTDKAFELDKKDLSKNLWASYNNQAIKQFSQMTQTDFDYIKKYATDNNIHFQYDPQKNEIGYGFGRPMDAVPGHFGTQPVGTYLNEGLGRINSGFKALAYIAKKNGVDPNQYIQDTLSKTVGFDLSTLKNPEQGSVQFPEDKAKAFVQDQPTEGDARQQHAFNFFVGKGYTREQAAGIVGGLAGETPDLNTQQIHDNGIGYGIGAWHGDRLEGLINYAKQNNLNPADLDTQLGYVDFELHGKESEAYDKIRGSTTPEEAALHFTNAYERPNAAKAGLANRIGRAQDFYKRFGKSKVAQE